MCFKVYNWVQGLGMLRAARNVDVGVEESGL